MTYKRASRLQQQPSPRCSVALPLLALLLQQLPAFLFSATLARAHSFWAKETLLFSFFAASTEFLRNGNCPPPQQVSGWSTLMLNKAASCNTCLRSFQAGSGLTPSPPQPSTGPSAAAFFSMVGFTGCPRTPRSKDPPVPRTPPFHSTTLFIPKPQFYFPLPVNSSSLYNFSMFPWILIATLCLAEVSLTRSFLHHCVTTKDFNL